MHWDSYYTPKILADKLIYSIPNRGFNTAADFCVGDGELLRSAKDRWSEIGCYGSDISADAIAQTKLTHPDWHLVQMDFLDESAHDLSNIFKLKYDLVLLNPPFSCVGGTIHKVNFHGELFQASTAMKFLTNALRYLQPDGVLYAILPTSIAYSQKDRKLWDALEKKHNLSILDEPKIQYFKRCTPNIIIVSLNDFGQVSKYKTITRISLDIQNIQIFRGKLSMDQVVPDNEGFDLIHTTNLKNNALHALNIKTVKEQSHVSGPAILLPRVGKPNINKICLIDENETYVLSDCIIAIKTSSFKDATILYRYFLDNREIVEDLYKGTGARYTTLEKLKQFLNLDIPLSDYQAYKAI